MQTRYSPTDYLYASARIRALEAELVGKEQFRTLLTNATVNDVIAALQEAAGISLTATEGEIDTEAALLALLKQGVATVAASVPDPAITHLVEYPYDCHNIKAYLKCSYRGLDPTALFIDAGSVAAKALIEALDSGDTAALPKHMATAIRAAKEAYARTADPREIDFLLDCALYADLAEAASGFPFAESLVSARADLTNIIICLRILRSTNADTAEPLFHKSMLPAGTLTEDFFATAFTEGEAAFLAVLSTKTPYAAVVRDADKCTLAEIEKRADDHITARLQEVKHLPFGAEIPLSYLYALEGAVKNLRILLSGKRAGLDGDKLKARVRESYV
ncbi:MAG: V-type ATPase subunit [Clostridia bacterium]|nr:V-type ATPase subunit [Clostridia bacterium]